MARPSITRMVGFPSTLRMSATTRACASAPRDGGADITADADKRIRMELSLPASSALVFGHNGRKRTGKTFAAGTRQPRMGWWLSGACGLDAAIEITVTIYYIVDPSQLDASSKTMVLTYP